MKGKNFLWGTALYLVMVTALYNRRDATLTVEESEKFGKTRTSLKGNKAGIAKYRAERLQTVSKPTAEFSKAYLKKDWVR